MEFWNSQLTEKSWDILQQLSRESFRFVVIGGWAAYLWTKQHKSKDIDILIDVKALETLRHRYNLRKNSELRKYEIKVEEIDIDIYIPHYSKLALPPEYIAVNTTKVEGFDVVTPEALLVLKQGAEEDRGHSIKGQKDRIDIMTLLVHAPIDFRVYRGMLEEHGLQRYRQRLKNIVEEFRDFKHLNTNAHLYAKTKRKLLKEI